MSREYESSKEVDTVRRYGQLKRIIKRAIMHLKLHQTSVVDDQHSASNTASSTGIRAKDELRKRADHIKGR